MLVKAKNYGFKPLTGSFSSYNFLVFGAQLWNRLELRGVLSKKSTLAKEVQNIIEALLLGECIDLCQQVVFLDAI